MSNKETKQENKEWVSDYGGLIVDADNQIIARVQDNHATGEITENQYLIAAAPELLAACEQALQLFESLQLGAPLTEGYLRLVIKKARGN